MALLVQVVDPPAGGVGPGDFLVFDITGDTPTAISATVTVGLSSPVVAYTLGGGFAGGYEGSVVSIAGGTRTTLRLTAGWPLGSLSLEVTASAGSGETTLYDNVFPTVRTVGSDFPGPPTVFEQTGIPFETFGTGTLRMSIDVDLREDGNGFGLFDAILFDPGHGPDQGFMVSPLLLNNYSVTLGFVNVVLTDSPPGSGNPYIDFAGPGVAQSLYLYTPRTPPTFDYSELVYRNLHVVIKSEGGGDVSDSRSWTVAWISGAAAVEGQTVRVVFGDTPTFRSPGGRDDAMNPSNYELSVDAGDATSPGVTTVSPILVVGPTRYVGNGGLLAQRGVDVHVDRALIAGITYRIVVSRVLGAGGSAYDPASAAFSGIVPLREIRRTPRGRPSSNVDYGNSPFLGSWRADDSGDVAPQDAASGFRKRVLRRLMTFKDSFAFLKGYGVTARLKELASLAEVAALKVDVERQIRLEPETASVQADTSLSALQVLTVVVRVKTRVGAFVEVGMRIDLAGGGATPF